jgi:hypothetical protein
VVFSELCDWVVDGGGCVELSGTVVVSCLRIRDAYCKETREARRVNDNVVIYY